MKNKMDTSFLDGVIKFAVDAHAGIERREKGFPYIVHPLEAMTIVATITSDKDLLAAAVLHDVIEDTEYTYDDLAERFGTKVAELVRYESEVPIENVPEEDTWHIRKQAAIDRIKAAPFEAKIVAMGDKLSNMRAIARDYAVLGDNVWKRFHTADKKEHAWHYQGLLYALSELAGTEPYTEFQQLVEKVFSE